MRIFLGALMLSVISGEVEVTINGVLDSSVLLPCNCTNRNMSKGLKWQFEQKCLIYNNSALNTSHKGRAKVFVADNSSNCSLLLTNLTADDQGKYKCIFSVGEMYIYSSINLNISEPTYDKEVEGSKHDDPQKLSPSDPKVPEQTKYVMRYYKAIPIGVVLVLSLVLWRRWKISRASQVEMDNFECFIR